MEQEFRKSDSTLAELVAARRDEVVREQTAEQERIKDLESRGQVRLADLTRRLPSEVANAFSELESFHEEAAAEAETDLENTTASMADTEPSPEASLAVHPGYAASQLISTADVGWLKPYHGTLHWSDGKVVWSGYNPGNIDLWVSCKGSGSGIFGTGSCSGTLVMDWWFSFQAPTNKNYGHTIYVPFNGFYIIKADDGFWDSKHAKARIDISAVGYQYNYKTKATTNVFDLGGGNINVNDRYDGYRRTYYSQLLGADRAYLRVSAIFHVYARGGGSVSQLNFSAGNANYIGVPVVYVD